MTPTTNVRIWWDTNVSAYRMASPFNKELVEAVKKFVPVSDRSYDPATKIWTFVERQLAPLQGLFKTLGIQPTIVTRQQAEQAQQSSSATGPRRGTALDALALEFLRLLPYDAAQAAYRKAAMTLHPDHGGDMQRMTALNAAWDRLQKEIYGQS